MNFSTKQIQHVLAQKNYVFFDKEKTYNLNIIGVRSSNLVANSFDDSLYLIYRDEGLHLINHRFDVTTDPGAYWLKSPLNIDGTAVLVPGQYRGSHKIGLHRGYKALVQKAPVKVWRDNDKDLEIDKGVATYEGIFGINIHRSNAYSESTIVEKWSAGCTVFKKVADFNFFMNICNKAKDMYGNSFTYTLLEEEDFITKENIIT